MHPSQAVVGSPALGGNLLALLGTALWASSFPATEHLLRGWDPLLLCFARLAGAALCLAFLALATGRGAELRRAPWRDVLYLGALGVAAPVFLLILGQTRADAVTVAVLSTMLPLISAVMGWALDGERPRAPVLAGILLAILGGSLASLAGSGPAAGPRGGEVLVLASMVLWIWYSRAALRRLAGLGDLAISGLTMAAGAAVVGLVGAMALASGFAAPRFDPSPSALVVLAWMSMAAIGLSTLLWFTCARLLGVTVAAIHTNLAPFYVMLIALAFGGRVVPQQVMGAVLVVVGALLAQIASLRRR
ncbi:DMT family transporter [Benzoatithermus flavus]|uniref:DMT family transporter n=1 Tax=Benzoatithermus flavus TaxID=3108223 RepID=A0ABU8XNE2_9PROT